jgi:tetratricopeptide (TPR) repeat protein
MMKNHHPLICLTTFMLLVYSESRAVEIKQNQSNSLVDQSVLNKPQGPGPDERILWQLFHASKFHQLSQQITHLKQRYPGWLPPTDLIKAVEQKTSVPKASKKKTPSSRKELIVTRDPCPHLLSRWRRAETYLNNHRPEKALEIYQSIVRLCPAKNKMQTLEKAQSRLEYRDFEQLLDVSRHSLPTLYLQQLRYNAIKDYYLGYKPLDSLGHERAVSELNDLLVQFQDDKLATVIGWRFFDRKVYDKAQHWFQQALTWNPVNDNAAYGQLLALEKAGQYNQALVAFAALKKPSTQEKAVASRIFLAKAWESFDRHQLDRAAEYALQAQNISGLDPEVQELNAWIAKQNGDYDKAAQWFEALYHQSPGRKYAQAYVQSQAQSDSRLLSQKAEQAGGELLDEYNRYQGNELYGRKQFQSAYKLAPDAFSMLKNIDSPYVDAGAYVRYKSGEDGLGRLDLFKAPIASAAYTMNGNHSFKISFSRVQLYSGSPGKCISPIGSLTPDVQTQAACGSNPAIFFSPTQQLNNAVEIDLSYRKDGWFSPFVNLGSTPIGGVIAPTVTFDVGFLQQTGFGNWGLQTYSQPVRQSILSYTGIKDPYANPALSSVEWGRVLRNGIKPAIFYRFNEHWNASGAIDLALLEGKNVEQNTTVSVSASVGRNISIAGFDYFNIGPSFNYEHFDKNLSHFTYGHGGYFSPEQYFNVGAGVNFLTNEGRPYVIKGRLTAGFQDFTESSVAWFPLGNGATGNYAASHKSGEAFDFELKGVWLVNPNFQLGAGAAVRKTSGYEDYTGGLFARYYFDGRKASFSTDIPASMFSLMY